MSSGFRQGLRSSTATRWLEPRNVRSVGRSIERNLHWSERLSGVWEAGAGPTARMSKGPFQFRERLVLSTMALGTLLAP